MSGKILRSLAVAALVAAPVVAFGQAVDESALDELDGPTTRAANVMREPQGAAELRAAMRRIALEPSDADALADAGNAALTLGDANAALNFFTRANAIRPRNGRIISGLAVATVRTENPFEALRLFDDAVKLGISERSIASDRALAFDLLGNFARAQQDYQLARTASVSDDLIIRHAVSLSLSGRHDDADGMLVPLLKKDNGAAWRTRAFILAARGDYRESTKVAQGFMDARSAQRMERYLRLMPELTGAQQAAAIHLGHFPANNIGRDSENVRRVAAAIPTPEPGRNDSRLIPSGEPFGSKPPAAKPVKVRKPRKRDRDQPGEVAKPVVLQRPVAVRPEKAAGLNTDGLSTDSARAAVAGARVATIEVAKSAELPPPETARPLVGIPASATAMPASQLPSAITPAASSVTVAQQIVFQPTPDAASAGIAGDATLPPATVPAASPAVAFDLASIIGAIEIPASEQKPSAVPVDLKRLKPPSPKVAIAETPAKAVKPDAKAAPKPAVAAQPARFWVQIATGDADALGFDYRRLAKKHADLFKGRSGWTSAWGRTDRLLVGPFADLKASKKWEADFRKGGGDAFGWASEKGVVVTPLKGK